MARCHLCSYCSVTSLGCTKCIISYSSTKCNHTPISSFYLQSRTHSCFLDPILSTPPFEDIFPESFSRTTPSSHVHTMPYYKANTQIQEAMDIRQILNALNVQRPLPTSHNENLFQDLGPESALCLSEASTQVERNAVAPSSPHSRTFKPASTSPTTLQAQRGGISEQNPAEQETNVLKTSMPVPNPRSSPTNEDVERIREESGNRSVTPSQTIDRTTFITQNPFPRPIPRVPSRIAKLRPKTRGRRVGGKELNGLKDWLSAPETSGLGSRGRTSWNSRSTWG